MNDSNYFHYLLMCRTGRSSTRLGARAPGAPRLQQWPCSHHALRVPRGAASRTHGSTPVLARALPHHSDQQQQHDGQQAGAAAQEPGRPAGQQSNAAAAGDAARAIAARAAAALAAGTLTLATLLAPAGAPPLLMPLAPAAAEARARLTPEEQLTVDVFKRNVPSVVNVTNLAVRWAGA